MAQRNQDDDWEPDEEEWKPPTEAEMKVIQAKRERSDKISKLMGSYLLKGYKMLGSSCGDCGTILLQTKQGKNYCVACSELDSDTIKDDPALSIEAARKQAAEQLQRDDSADEASADGAASSHIVTSIARQQTNSSTKGQQPEVPYQFPLIHRPCPEAVADSSRFNHLEADSNDQQFQSISDLPVTGMRNMGLSRIQSNLSQSDLRMTLGTVEEKLLWATSELKKCSSVEYSIQLCQLIKVCADTLSSLNTITIAKVGYAES